MGVDYYGYITQVEFEKGFVEFGTCSIKWINDKQEFALLFSNTTLPKLYEEEKLVDAAKYHLINHGDNTIIPFKEDTLYTIVKDTSLNTGLYLMIHGQLYSLSGIYTWYEDDMEIKDDFGMCQLKLMKTEHTHKQFSEPVYWICFGRISSMEQTLYRHYSHHVHLLELYTDHDHYIEDEDFDWLSLTQETYMKHLDTIRQRFGLLLGSMHIMLEASLNPHKTVHITHN